MSIAEKEAIMSANNKTMAENQQKVYDAGYAAGQAEGGVDNAQYVTRLNNLYENAAFPDGYELVLNVPQLNNTMASAFSAVKGVKKIKIICNTDGEAVTMLSTYRSVNIEVVDLSEFTRAISSMQQSFYYAQGLREVIGELDLSSVTSVDRAFMACTALEEVRIKAGTLSLSISFVNSPLLSDGSIQSIIDGLADLTGSETKTLTLHASIVLTDEQKATIAAKNWTLVQ